MVGENFEFICLKLLELPKESSNKFHDFGHFPKKKFNKKDENFPQLVRTELKMELLTRKKICSVGWGTDLFSKDHTHRSLLSANVLCRA